MSIGKRESLLISNRCSALVEESGTMQPRRTRLSVMAHGRLKRRRFWARLAVSARVIHWPCLHPHILQLDDTDSCQRPSWQNARKDLSNRKPCTSTMWQGKYQMRVPCNLHARRRKCNDRTTQHATYPSRSRSALPASSSFFESTLYSSTRTICS